MIKITRNLLILLTLFFSNVTEVMAQETSFLTLTNEQKPLRNDISDEFPYQAKKVEVANKTLQYFEAGDGDPILFLHGIPAHSYIWRNIMPYLESEGRVIALDLPGFGGSERGEECSLHD